MDRRPTLSVGVPPRQPAKQWNACCIGAFRLLLPASLIYSACRRLNPVSQKVGHFYFYVNFGNSGPIFTFFHCQIQKGSVEESSIKTIKSVAALSSSSSFYLLRYNQIKQQQ